jgi:hypothetical protein
MATMPVDWAATPEAVAHLPRNAVHAMIDRLIGWLDEQDGDPDLEANGDELDGTAAEDEPGAELSAWHRSGPGCPITDPDLCLAGDDGVFSGAVMMTEIGARQAAAYAHHEIGNEDDAEPAGDERDHNHSEDDFIVHLWGGGPGCPVSDPGGTGDEM